MTTIMNSTVSNFFSRDSIFKRHARAPPRNISRPTLQRSSSLKGKSLQIIVEEEESRASCSRSPSPMSGYSSSTSAGGSQTLGVKAKRRHANLLVTDIQFARGLAIVDDDNHVTERVNASLLSPPPAPQPPQAPTEPSPDSFKLTFTDVSFKFPHPPIPTPSSLGFHDLQPSCGSPTPSMCSSGSSSCSQNAGLPPTPSSSDDEFFLPSPRFNPRRAAIKPLVIHKHNTPSTSPSRDPIVSETHMQPFKIATEHTHSSPSSPTSSSENSSPYESDSDAESDSEWYNNELSKILTLCSPIPSSFPIHHPARPDSMFVPSSNVLSNEPKCTNKTSSTSPLAGVPNGQLDPAFPRRRRSRRSIPTYPPPPVPPIPAHLRSLSNSSIVPTSPISPLGSALSFSQMSSPLRPPPRTSVPSDFIFDDDDSSAFSFSLYEDDTHLDSPGSAYSQPSFQDSKGSGGLEMEFPLDETEFDLDVEYPMMLPLSLPGTPIDLEADILHGLEELRLRGTTSPYIGALLEVVPEEANEVDPNAENVKSIPQSTLHSQAQLSAPSQSQVMDVFNMPSPSLSSPDSVHRVSGEERVLKSKWSSSTLGSIREEHERRTPSKLRLYFRNSPSKTKRSASGSKSPPLTPVSPYMPLVGKKHRFSGRRESDVLIIGHASNGVGVRRRGSVTPTLSDAGSEDSSSSSSSSGLRRKPIPLELFLRNTA